MTIPSTSPLSRRARRPFSATPLSPLGLLLLAVACGTDAGDSRSGSGEGDTEFLSHVPGQSSGVDAAGSGGAAAAAPSEADGNTKDDAERAISEADILQVSGDRLYALSRYSGLTVIDISNAAKLSVLGVYRASAEPFEMYLEGNTAYVMFNGWSTYVYDEESESYSWQSSSRLQALDVSDPANIELIGDEVVAGEISDSRKVGEVLYLVTHQTSWCWRCDTVASTRVTSFDVSDPAEFSQVDQVLYETEDESWGRRSVSVTPEHVYVSGWSWTGDEQMAGTIDVVDISDPAGDLEKGTSIGIAGQIQSRWQMEEEDGILRVISQPGGWGTTIPPVLETFEVASADSITKLASLEMVLPRPESLRSVRFDGDRAYAVTFEQTDPLFTFDLSDPADPKQLGELEIPGWVYHMEPRGDRIYALGYDNTSEEGALHVSLFDVSDLANPTMLDRVNFGGDWASFAEDQDRIHKAFNIVSDEGLILVPFDGWDYTENYCDSGYVSGIQLVDMTTDDLTLRGVAPQVGAARRALFHEGTLFGISDNAVQTFDITDRDAPEKLDQLDVARNVTSLRVMGSTLMRFGSDWWTDRTVLDFTKLDQATIAEPLGELDLSEAIGGNDRLCSESGNGYYSESWGGQVFVHQSYAYVPRYASVYTELGGYKQKLALYIVDLHDRSEPKVIGSVAVPTVGDDEWYGGIVQTDGALLVGRVKGNYYYDPSTGERGKTEYSYDVIDLGNPEAPEVVTRFAVPSLMARGGWGYGMGGCMVDVGWGWWGGYYYGGGSGALVSGDIVVSQHEEEADDGTGRVRYYLDRIDVSDPTKPKVLSKINIPGNVVHYEHDTGRLVTMDYVLKERPARDWQDCYDDGDNFYSYFDERDGMCRTYRRRANSLVVEGDVARRIDTHLIDDEAPAGEVAVSDDRLFYVTDVWRENGPSERRLHSIGYGAGSSFEALPEVELDESIGWWGQLVARDGRAFLTGSNRLTVVDARGDGAPQVTSHEMPGWSCGSLEVRDDTAYCALGQYGVATFPLD